MVRRFPWWDARFGIVSWWDMEQFGARAFYQLGRLLEKVRIDHRIFGSVFLVAPRLDQPLTSQQADGLKQFIRQVRKRCARLGLGFACDSCDHIAANADGFTHREAAEQLATLDRAIRSEMKAHLFFFISPGEAELYTQDQPLFGQTVGTNFPSADFDIGEAGRCLALSRATACVMHLGRVVECGLKVLASELKLPLRNDWGKHHCCPS